MEDYGVEPEDCSFGKQGFTIISREDANGLEISFARAKSCPRGTPIEHEIPNRQSRFKILVARI